MVLLMIQLFLIFDFEIFYFRQAEFNIDPHLLITEGPSYPEVNNGYEIVPRPRPSAIAQYFTVDRSNFLIPASTKWESYFVLVSL